MIDIPVPPEALSLATDDLTAWMLKYGWITGLTADQVRSVCEAVAQRVLENGDEIIRVAERRRIGEASFSPDEDDRTGLFRLARADGLLAERERICQLADHVGAFYPDPDAPGLTVPFADLIGGAPESDDSPDVHVDWHMTPAEWAELREALLRNPDGPYVGRLIAEGKLGA